MKRLLLNFGRILLLLLILIVGAAVYVARQQGINVVTPGRRPVTETPSDHGVDTWETVAFFSSDGLTLKGYFIPPAPDSNGATLIYTHGLSGNRGHLLQQAAFLHEHGYGGLLYDQRGHGESDGELTTLGLTEIHDVEGALAFLATQPSVNMDQIGMVGQSLGCITAVRAAARLPEIDVLVAEACMTSIEDNVADGVRELAGLPPFPFAPMVVFFGSQEAGVDIDQVRPIDDLAQYAPRPVLFIHGSDDELFNVKNAEQMFAAASEPKELYIIDGATHYPLYSVEPTEFSERLIAFLDTHFPNSQ